MKRLLFPVIILSVLSASSAFAQAPVNANALSGSSMLSAASKAVERVEAVISDAQQRLNDARAVADVAQMDCINAQLVNAKGFLNVVQNGESNLRDAVARNDETAQQHHYKLVQLAVSKVETIQTRIAECTSGVIGLSGETVMETTRVCKVEPCVGGEEYYDPGHSESHAGGSQVETNSLVDASPYL